MLVNIGLLQYFGGRSAAEPKTATPLLVRRNLYTVGQLHTFDEIRLQTEDRGDESSSDYFQKARVVDE